MQKHRINSSGGSRDSTGPGQLGLLTALSLVGTLTYVFVLLVPAWRTVQVDRALIGAFLANQSSAGRPTPDPRLWDALARDPMLRSRSANAFRECLLTADDAYNATAAGGPLSSPSSQPTGNHLLETLAGVINASSLPATAAAAAAAAAAAKAEHKHSQPRHRIDRCWFLDLQWSADGSQARQTGHSYRNLLRSTRALFLIAVCLLLCYCVCLTGSLYACFAARMPRPCRCLMLAAHCLSLSQLVALAVLQDVSARVAAVWLRDLVADAGFPEGSTQAIDASSGTYSLVLFCILCLASAVQMLLLLLPPIAQQVARRRRHQRQSENPIVGAGAAAAGDKEDGEKMRECDDAEDTNPLI